MPFAAHLSIEIPLIVMYCIVAHPNHLHGPTRSTARRAVNAIASASCSLGAPITLPFLNHVLTLPEIHSRPWNLAKATILATDYLQL